MRDVSAMMSDRVVQVFLNHSGIFEVAIKHPGMQVYCNCPVYAASGKCKHSQFVEARIRQNGGQYRIPLPSHVTVAEVKEAQKSSEAFRDFVIKHARVEVI